MWAAPSPGSGTTRLPVKALFGVSDKAVNFRKGLSDCFGHPVQGVGTARDMEQVWIENFEIIASLEHVCCAVTDENLKGGRSQMLATVCAECH